MTTYRPCLLVAVSVQRAARRASLPHSVTEGSRKPPCGGSGSATLFHPFRSGGIPCFTGGIQGSGFRADTRRAHAARRGFFATLSDGRKSAAALRRLRVSDTLPSLPIRRHGRGTHCFSPAGNHPCLHTVMGLVTNACSPLHPPQKSKSPRRRFLDSIFTIRDCFFQSFISPSQVRRTPCSSRALCRIELFFNPSISCRVFVIAAASLYRRRWQVGAFLSTIRRIYPWSTVIVVISHIRLK